MATCNFKRWLHVPFFPRHHATAFITIDLRACKACGACVAVCSREVLGLIALGRHRHVHVNCAEACKGCGRCIEVCAEQAICACIKS